MHKKIIVVAGLPGVGKSTVAEALAEKLQFPLFSVDPIESAILQSGIPKSFETGLAAYLVAQKLADEQLKRGMSIIIDSVSPVKEARTMWYELEKKHKAQLFIIECQLDETTHKDRLKNRVRNMHGMPEVTWEDVEDRKKGYQQWEEDRLIINTAQSNEENIQKALRYINRTS